jgi:hypothetical protein
VIPFLGCVAFLVWMELLTLMAGEYHHSVTVKLARLLRRLVLKALP